MSGLLHSCPCVQAKYIRTQIAAQALCMEYFEDGSDRVTANVFRRGHEKALRVLILLTVSVWQCVSGASPNDMFFRLRRLL